MKKIAVITATRAEYGLLRPLIEELRRYENNDFYVDLVVTGTHLYEDYGKTINEIIEQKIRIDETIKISVASNDSKDISSNQADALVQFTKLFNDKKYAAIVILGDRYEMLAIAIAAGNTHTPIIHLCGGDTTEGAIDEWIRHSITKMSYLHFTTCEESKRRVIQLGEEPERVYNFGSTSIDNILSMTTMSKAEALADIGLSDCEYAICTYHPVTMEDDTAEKDILNLLEAIKRFPNIEFIITKSNSDQNGQKINKILDEKSNEIKNIHVYSSLGVKRYLSLMREALFVIGNSSSGIVEAPAFGIPTINIGNRQRGRLQASSIINCDVDTSSIQDAIYFARSKKCQEESKKTSCPYGNGNAAKHIAKVIFESIIKEDIDLKKKFYDI